ncbi:MAG: TIGR03936 family radical SAM-associated protein [Lachnospiraceae bacterium]|nr:TIGR03936 family radical SAM-associated protein [Lachnospiraceae bacterium]
MFTVQANSVSDKGKNMVIRFKFKKFGPIVYIGHLDIMRFFQKAIRRSGIDAAYTEGFSPHLKLSFAQPLSVGIETDGDYFDLEMNTLPDMTTLVKDMNGQCVEGIEIVSATLLDDGVLNAMSSVKAADYLYTFDDLSEDLKLIEDFFSQESYVFEYIRKDKLKRKDLMEDIYDHKILNEKEIIVKVNSSSAGNLKADVVIEALNKFGVKAVCKKYKRTELYTADENGKFISLASLGQIYD